MGNIFFKNKTYCQPEYRASARKARNVQRNPVSKNRKKRKEERRGEERRGEERSSCLNFAYMGVLPVDMSVHCIHVWSP
jgi:hypothetical protein